ncbi:MAG: hypothetical protein J6Z22_00920, partial [Lachnospiraceae bacterium]|nr:hypothetical protein [Lachnospiraceae bacterium]
AWLTPFLSQLHLSNQEKERSKLAFCHLAEALQSKNMFILSKARCEEVIEAPWKDGRLVMVCGRTNQMQCKNACENSKITPVPEDVAESLKQKCLVVIEKTEKAGNANASLEALPDQVREAMKMIAKRQEILDGLAGVKETINQLGKCPECGEPLEFNVFECEKYDERGYLKDWEKYTKWLGGSRNRKLLLMEIGCGDAYPNVISKPFEKIAELNQKAKILKINENIIDCLEKL